MTKRKRQTRYIKELLKSPGILYHVDHQAQRNHDKSCYEFAKKQGWLK